MNVCQLRLAADGMGHGREVGYINVSVFAKAGDAAAEYLAKAWLVAVDGRLEYGEWDSERTKRHDYNVVGNVEFLTAPKPVEEPADLLVAGRRRAGLSQEQLADRLGRTQSTIARWESGYQRPPLESVVEALHACGLELTVGMARYDDSYESLIGGQLLLEPVERVRRLARKTAGFDPIVTLSELSKDARFVVIGKVAGAFNGWPIVLGTPALHVVPADKSAHAIE
ncbi:MAG: transcriptional regulator, family [Solirubrobacterales bacterium]|nr:transcriptional regulator, family [Solirubrobacterales bacterium]